VIATLRALLWFVGLGRPREGDVYVATYDGHHTMTVEVLAVAEDAAVVTIWTLDGSRADGLQAITSRQWSQMLRQLRLRRVER
jgi:hypothetical protein